MPHTVPGLTQTAMLDASPIPTSVVDAEGTVMYVNDAFLAYASTLHGREVQREERVGANVRAFITGKGDHTRRNWLDLYDRLLAEGESVSQEAVCTYRGPGQERYADIKMSAIRGEDGHVTAAVLTWQDVTDRVRARQEERRHAALDRVRVVAYRMRRAVDIQHVLMALYGALRTVDLKLEECSVQIVDEQKMTFECYYPRPDMVVPLMENSLADSAVYEAWREQRAVYRRDLDREDPYNEKRDIRQGSGKPIRSVLDVPFTWGTIGINSVLPEAFSEEDIKTLERFAEVLSDAYTQSEFIQRVEDSEERYRSLVEHSRDAIFRLDLVGNYVLISPIVEYFLGYTPEEFYADREIGRRIVLPEDFERSAEAFRKASVGEISTDVEYRVRGKNGKIIWVSQTTFPVQDAGGRIVAIEGTIRDITQHKRMDQALEKRTGLQERLLEAAQYLTESLDLAEVLHRIATFAREILDAHGCTIYLLEANGKALTPVVAIEPPYEEEILATPLDVDSSFTGRAIRDRRSLIFNDAFTTEPGHQIPGTPPEEEERVIVAPFVIDGRVLGAMCLNRMGVPFSEEDLAVVEMFAAYASTALKNAQAHDRLQTEVEERKRVENALRESEERFRELAELLPAIVCEIDEQGYLTFANRNAYAATGYTEKDFEKGLNALEMMAPEDRDQARQNMGRVLAGENLDGTEYKALRKDGTTFPIVVYSNAVLRAGRPAGLRAIIADITEQKEAEERLLRQERLAAVGQLSAGIAHDFNNLLTGIIGYAELLEMRTDLPQDARTDLRRIVGEGQRAAYLIRQILDFSRQSIIQRQPLDLSVFLKESVRFLKRTIPERIHIRQETDANTYSVRADPTQIQQMLTNLAVNARDAMPEGGELLFRLSHFTLNAGQDPPCAEMSPGEWVMLSVSDTGTGISAEDKQRVFEPFFTTKEVGEGTGLGLAQVYGIVMQHEGAIDLVSEPGKGTEFLIYLPYAPIPEGLEEKSKKPTSTELPQGRGETILVVEDDPIVLHLIRDMVERLGYHALIAVSGSEALEIYEQHGEKIAITLTDMVMPGVDGVGLFRALRGKNPDARVVMMTGYPLGDEGKKLVSEGITAWVQKPMRLEKLAQLLNGALA